MKKHSSKIWFILYPFVVYMLTKTITLLCIAILLECMRENTDIVNILPVLQNRLLCSAVSNGVASIAGAAFLYRKFLDETTFHGEYDPDANVIRQTILRIQASIAIHKRRWYLFLIISFLGGMSAIAFNMLIQLMSVQSKTYENVESIQYSVPVWVGIILYGFVSPVVEEIIFRGLLYNRMRKHFSKGLCIFMSSIMFGGFHGNMTQFLYGFLMGVLIVLAYDLTDSFSGAVLYHMMANITVYLLSTCFPDAITVSILNCAIFVTISIAGWISFYVLCQKK